MSERSLRMAEELATLYNTWLNARPPYDKKPWEWFGEWMAGHGVIAPLHLTLDRAVAPGEPLLKRLQEVRLGFGAATIERRPNGSHVREMDEESWDALCDELKAIELALRAPAPPEPLCRCGSTYDLETGVCNRTGILANGCDAAPLAPAPPAEGPDTATLTKKLRAVIQEHSPEHFSVAMRPEAFVQWLVANISQ